VRRISF